MRFSASHSVRSKRLLTFAAIFLAAKLSASAVVHPGAATHTTPYGRHLTTVRRTFDHMGSDRATLDRVNTLVRRGRSFRYTYSEPYRAAAPAETATRRAGDCKDKALWLMDQLPDQNVRFVVGKLDRRARLNHAWLLWKHDDQWWILDCTMRSRAIPADRVRANQYIPAYTLSRGSVYRRLVRNPL